MRHLLILLDGENDRSRLREYLEGVTADETNIIQDGAVSQGSSRSD